MGTTAGIVIIGDEILSGKFAEENAKYLIPQLRELGVRLRRVVVIPDEVDDIANTVRDFGEHFDHVFTSGGVGPTHDDVTIRGIARGFGTRVVRHPELERAVRGFFGERAEQNLRLAEVPEGSVLIGEGDDLKWPVVCYRNVYILPGVPVIFRRKFDAIRERFRAAPFANARVYSNADEGQLAPMLDEIVAAFPAVQIGSYPRFGEPGYRVIITLESKDAAAVSAAREALCKRLGDLVVDGEDS